jgi:hypothetical protein
MPLGEGAIKPFLHSGHAIPCPQGILQGSFAGRPSTAPHPARNAGLSANGMQPERREWGQGMRAQDRLSAANHRCFSGEDLAMGFTAAQTSSGLPP